MARDPATAAHQEWLGYVQPSGLVVSIPALLEANAVINQNYAPDHRRFLSALPADENGEPKPEIPDFAAFAQAFFGWTEQDLCGAPGTPALPESLEIPLPEYHETLRPTYALKEDQRSASRREWLLLVKVLDHGAGFDKVAASDDRNWQATPQAKFERLLRQTHVGIGLLVNDRQIRLVYAPEKELSGHVTFNVADMVTVAGRPILSAMHMLLNAERLYVVAEKERLPAILENSRKYQNVVSTQLATQVVEALYQLLRGYQAANDQTQGALLRDVLARDPEEVYRGLLTVLLRLVFVLYAEDRGLLSTEEVYSNFYSVTGLYERLRSDDGRFHDTMDQRFGAWAQLLVLFRLIHSGARHGKLRIPAREGYLFDPDRYLFLEGRHHQKDQPDIPRVSDGVIFNVLSKLLILDGERLSYRTLAVEQIGSVYQAIMGFGLRVAEGRSIAIKPAKKHGAPATINLEQLLRTPPDKRVKWLDDEAGQKLTGQAAEALKSAKTVEELLVALEKKIASAVTPAPVPKGAMIFEPSDERRKSGSHYTPSSLTGPIVEAALEPVLKQLGDNPTPAQILNLKVCDPAMGSAAFLVEACRELGDALVKAWHAHNEVPSIPPDEDEALYAQRIVAQRCLYGLDKNPMATDLAKLSLWLATLAKDHPFTFLDHSLRCGDALVGLSRKQIAAFNWAPAAQQTFFEEKVRNVIDRVSEFRQRILNARENTPYGQLAQELGNADDALSVPRMVGDAVVAAFFSGEKPKAREERRKRFQALVEADLKKQGMIPVGGEVDRTIKELRGGHKAIPAFHWEMEFPEVFITDSNARVIGGFDVIVGNPPFMSGTRISEQLGMPYFAWLTHSFPPAGHLCDLVAYFFRRVFQLLRTPACFGLIATNTIAQGDTREGSLAPILSSGGGIYSALRRLRWPGEAAVVVSCVHISKGLDVQPVLLNGRKVTRISAFLLKGSVDASPRRLHSNPFFSAGSKIYGQGFLFDDRDADANPSALQQRILAKDSRYASRVLPYIGGEEVNSNPTHQPERTVIFLSDIKEENDLNDWPMLVDIVRAKVKPERKLLGDNPNNIPLKRRWWAYQAHRPELYKRVRKLDRVLVNSQVSGHLAFTFLPGDWIYAHTLNVFEISSFSGFCVLQSRTHEVWARFLGSSMKDDLRYTPSDCFETFPFALAFGENLHLANAGRRYFEHRARVMIDREEGLTKIYNRFHSPDEDAPDIVQLRLLHNEMDRVVLDAYGWTDIQPQCEFIPEFEDEEGEDDNGRPRKKKYRYRWPDEIRDEVLGRLLDLNRQRALEEGQMLPGDQPPDDASRKPRKTKKRTEEEAAENAEATPNMFAAGKGES